MVVDDEKAIRRFCQKVLIRNNFVVETADSVKGALEILDDTFCLVISDLRMPDSDGLWLSNQIKNKFNGKIPVFIMTASIGQVNIAEKEVLGVSDFLLKPFTIDELLAMVYQCLESKKLQLI